MGCFDSLAAVTRFDELFCVARHSGPVIISMEAFIGSVKALVSGYLGVMVFLHDSGSLRTSWYTESSVIKVQQSLLQFKVFQIGIR